MVTLDKFMFFLKKHWFLLGLTGAAAMLSVPVYAADPNYIGEKTGIFSINALQSNERTAQNEQDPVPAYSGINLITVFSKRFTNFRLEAEVGYQRNDADKISIDSGVLTFKGNYSVTSYMANGYYDFKTGVVNPYVTAGFGLAQVSVHNVTNPPTSISETYSGLGYQFGGGIALRAAKNIALDFRYRNFRTYPSHLNRDNGYSKIPGNMFLFGLIVGI